MAEAHPNLVVLAGPNGSGKSTIAPALLAGTLAVKEFVNADTIAQGLSAFNPAAAAIQASAIMFRRIRELARRRVSFAFETTLAGRTLAPWIRELTEGGYSFRLLFLWLPSADNAVDRVASRVRTGGHDVPESTVRRRYDSGLRNFFTLYQPLAITWRMYDNSRWLSPRLIASGARTAVTRIDDHSMWNDIRNAYDEQT
jgi:predicted ABC-type ATPase